MIEIKELFIKVNIESDVQKTEAPKDRTNFIPLDKRELMEEYLEQVALLLKNKKER